MTISDLIFAASFFVCLFFVLRLVWLAIRQRGAAVRATARNLALFAGAYTIALAGFALATPRQIFAPGERRCFDDWCVAAGSAEREATPALCPASEAVWVASLDVSSVARRIRQRAADASVELEDASGRRYAPCSAGAANRRIREFLAPGEAITVSIPFGLPASARPVGLVVHHGDFPGVVIIGADQSWLHQPALLSFR